MSAVLARNEVKPIVDKLLKTYPTILGHVDPDRILYVRAAGKKKAATIKAVSTPYDLAVNERFILTIHSAKFDKLDHDRQAIAIFDELIRIKDFDGGKLKGYSVVSNYETVVKWGADWEESDDNLSAFDSSNQ